ncbi:MAG: radical SAM protein [Burkholderiales bacterium]|nr:radical SAM protein [Burkholderiales bacterium]
MQKSLNFADHARESAGLVYVYPVVSRRSGGVSLGINLNPNNACNWRCIYCQVPDLSLGSAPKIDLQLLENELSGFLQELLHGKFMEERVPEGLRRINDIAISGNGEPTSAARFAEIVELVGSVMKHSGLSEDTRLVLITNGSLMHRKGVQAGIARMAESNGEVWFKLDSATCEGRKRINDTTETPGHVFSNLSACSSLCPTWIQTCVFETDGTPPSQEECDAYVEFLAPLASDLAGVLLYGLARKSLQPGGERLSPVSREWMDSFAKRIEAAGLAVKMFL